MLKSNDSELKYFEQLFGSKVRVKLLRLFLVAAEPPTGHYLREICRTTGEHLNSVRRELDGLEKLGLITKEKSDSKKDSGKVFYKINKDFVLFNELRALFIKSQMLLKKSVIQGVNKIGHIKLLILTGGFTANKEVDTDLLVVGRVKIAALSKLIKQLEKELGRSINYTLMSTSEFTYRRDLTDLFLYNILENKKSVLIDTLGIDRKEKSKDYSRRKIQVKKVK